MLDIKFIIDDPEKLKKGISKKRSNADIDKIVDLYNKRKEKLLRVESLRAQQNEVSKNIKDAPDKEKLMAEMSKVKEEIKNLEPEIAELENQIDALALQVPNPTLDSVPEGKDDTENVVIRTHGQKPEFDFEPKDHIELGKTLDIIDIERGTRTSGTRFYYLKNEAVELEMALVQHIMRKLVSKGFSPIIPPVLVKEEAMYATGFFPADRNEIYNVNPEEDNMFLVGTSEVPLNMLHAGEILDESTLPMHYCGFSTCFRREAGSYGKDTAGVLRVHQFNKMEMFVFCKPEESEEKHEMIIGIEEEVMQDLKLHYQVINICGGDLGAPAAKKYDIEAWIPTQNKFRELTSCSNCTDFQARRSKIRYKTKDGKNEYIHTLNGTAFADTRTIIAILENYQNKDGSVTIPEVLQPYMGGKTRIEKK